jgi:hypothetical protein
LNKLESSSLMTMSTSAFGWQRRKESDDIKPLVPEGWSFRHDRLGSAQGDVLNSSASHAWRSWLNFGAQMTVCPLEVASVVWALLV